jgi:subtilisin-like proprotein convertase family protein
MSTRRLVVSFSLLMLITIAACGGGGGGPLDGGDAPDAFAPDAAVVPPDAMPAEVCNNVFDDDHDGFIDCDDTDCYGEAVCDETACHDTIDNDHDDLVDCDDPHCAKSPACRPEALCHDGLDDDSDGYVDCQDVDDCADACAAACADTDTPVVLTTTGFPFAIPDLGDVDVSFSSGGTGVITSAGVRVGATHHRDNDLDITLTAPGGRTIDVSSDNGSFQNDYIGTTFSDDADLSIVDGTPPFTGTFLPEEPFARLAGADTAGTWTINVADDTTGQTGQVESAEVIVCVCDGNDGCEHDLACLNGVDDDNDDLADCEDPDCADVLVCIHEVVCDDGLDEEPDGLIDCADPDCDDSAYCMAEPNCHDGTDDDSDGHADCTDPGCDGIDACELGTELTCDDGLDNDNDGDLDCDDSDCAIFQCRITCAPGEIKRIYASTDVPLSILDNATVVSDIVIAEEGLVTNVAIDLDITHTYDGDVDLFLVPPTGAALDVCTGNGGGSDNFVDTFLIDSATTPVTSGTGPFTGDFRPEQAFSNLDGRQLAGTWGLRVGDHAGGDTGALTSFTLLTCACDPEGGECEFGAEACRNGIDDDNDETIDCDEASCATDPTCIPETNCADGIDQDLDGLIDCHDPSCDGISGCEVPTETTCDDGFDNDADAAVDCLDTDCDSAAACVPEVDCTNGIDDDSDGFADCLDPACDGIQGCERAGEVSCNDGFDNDGDTLTDCADPTCAPQLICAIPSCPAGEIKTVYTATGLPLTIPDNGEAANNYLVHPIAISAQGLVSTVAVRIDISHTWDSDLDLFLVAPGGAQRELSSDNGGSGDNYTGTTFVDSAALAITSGNAPFTGRFRPEQAFSTLAGTPVAGNWSLRAGDGAGGDVGTLVTYQLLTCACDPALGECEYGATACRNGTDDDGDGLVDCDEAACDTDPYCIPEAICNDAIDNDLDALVDCADASCNGLNRCEFATERTCTDAFDNDADGLSDCLDPDCAAAPECLTETDCDNGLDEDGDTLIDCDDDDCDADLGCVVEVDCQDGLDNDGDGNIDCLDLGCDGFQGCTHGSEVACADGIDNDGDGGTDCLDTECAALVSCTIPTCPAGQVKTVYTQTAGLPLTIPDNGVAANNYANSTIPIATAGLVSTVAVRFDITHTFDADLDIYLQAPQGIVELTTDNGSSGDNFTGTIIIDSAPTAVTAGVAPMTGRFRPELPLSNLSGTALAGNWSLKVGDDAGSDTGQITAYTLVTCSCDAASGNCELGFACGNGVDDDGDGLSDCADPNCAAEPACVAPSEHVCNDTLDDDGDGNVDCADSDCAWACAALSTCPAGDKLLAYRSEGLPQAISATGTSILNAPVRVGSTGTLVTAAVRFNAAHTADNDIDFTMTSAVGTFRDVSTDNGGTNDNFVDTVFVDSAGTGIASGVAPFTGNFRPEGAFSVLAAQPVFGVWNMQVADDLTANGGSWTEASLGLCVAP